MLAETSWTNLIQNPSSSLNTSLVCASPTMRLIFWFLFPLRRAASQDPTRRNNDATTDLDTIMVPWFIFASLGSTASVHEMILNEENLSSSSLTRYFVTAATANNLSTLYLVLVIREDSTAKIFIHACRPSIARAPLLRSIVEVRNRAEGPS